MVILHYVRIYLEHFYEYQAVATGEKLDKATGIYRKEDVYTITDYAGNFTYQKIDSSEFPGDPSTNDVYSLLYFNHPEGYAEPKDDGTFQYVYQYKDIWGNTRVTYSDANSDGKVEKSEIRREQNYYPFGGEHKGYNTTIVGVKNNLKTPAAARVIAPAIASG